MLEYEIGEGVQAFTAGRGEALPCEVTQAHQVHGHEIARIDRPGVTREELEGYDALITDVPGIAIGVRTADCIPILLYDETHHAVAAIHSGWKGTIKRISQKVIFRMRQEYGTAAGELRAVIGPGICKDCFQVGEEVVGFFHEMDFPIERIYSWNGAKKDRNMSTGHHIDLFEANRFLLCQSGVPETRIHVCGLCTYEDEGFYSARREGIECGRNITAICLKPR